MRPGRAVAGGQALLEAVAAQRLDPADRAAHRPRCRAGHAHRSPRLDRVERWSAVTSRPTIKAIVDGVRQTGVEYCLAVKTDRQAEAVVRAAQRHGAGEVATSVVDAGTGRPLVLVRRWSWPVHGSRARTFGRTRSSPWLTSRWGRRCLAAQVRRVVAGLRRCSQYRRLDSDRRAARGNVAAVGLADSPNCLTAVQGCAWTSESECANENWHHDPDPGSRGQVALGVGRSLRMQAFFLG